MANPFRLGLLSHLEGRGDPTQIYRNTLELFVAAEELGFEVAWIAQHHIQDFAGRLPSPFPFLAAAAERTKRLRLGTAVVILPLEHPLRVAEDAAVVDRLSGGRLELGVGSGFDPYAFEVFRVDHERRRELTSHHLTELQRALNCDAFNTVGHRIQPGSPGLNKRLWQAVFSASGGQYAAHNGVGLMLNRSAYGFTEPTDQVQTPWARAYLDAWDSRSAAPRIAVSRTVYPAADARTARADLAEGVEHFVQGMIKQDKLPAGLSLEEYLHRLHTIHGSPDDVVAQIKADTTVHHATDLLCQFNPGVPSLDQSLRAIERIARDVAPQLGWRPLSHASPSIAEYASIPAGGS